MVCQGYKAPDYIDPKLLDPKYALEEVEEDNGGTSTDKITSLKKLLTTKKNRDGYDKAKSFNLYAECDFVDFLKSNDPHEYLSGYNRFVLNEEALALIKNIKLPVDFTKMCDDLKVCGRKEFSDLLKVRHRYIGDIESANRA